MFVVFISHDLEDANLLRILHEKLAVGHAVTFITDECNIINRASERVVFHEMATQIRNADVFLIYLTKSYIDKVGDENNRNDICQLEYLYAIRQKTAAKMVTVIIDPEVKDSKTWLGIVGLLPTELSIDFTEYSINIDNDEYLTQKFTEIHDKMNLSLHFDINSTETSFKDLDGIFFPEEEGGLSMALWRANHTKNMIALAKLKSEAFKKGYRKLSTGIGEYEGKIDKNVRSGYGLMRYRDGGKVYAGSWVQDVPDGVGKLTYANNDMYEGEFSMGVPHGTGKLTSANGDIFEGLFDYGMKQGPGKKYLAESGDVEIGVWKHDVFQKIVEPGAWKF